MKLSSKTINLAAGVIFLLRAVSSIMNVISQASSGILFYISPLILVFSVYGIIILTIMGVHALKQKKRGKVLNTLGAIYLGYAVFNMINGMRHGFSLGTLVSLVLLVAAFLFTQKPGEGTMFSVKDTNSEAAKVQVQAEKQTTIYDEQLQAGILTQEEYDQIMQNQN